MAETGALPGPEPECVASDSYPCASAGTELLTDEVKGCETLPTDGIFIPISLECGDTPVNSPPSQKSWLQRLKEIPGLKRANMNEKLQDERFNWAEYRASELIKSRVKSADRSPVFKQLKVMSGDIHD